MIHIVDGQNGNLLDFISKNSVVFNTHKQSLENYLETFDLELLTAGSYVDQLTKRNRLIIPAEDNGYVEFIIYQVAKHNDKIDVYTTASYLDLQKEKVISPTILNGYTAKTAVDFTLNKTGWQAGIIESNAIETIDINTHTNPLALLKRIAKVFNLELKFRIETDGNGVTNRYVDLLNRVGAWNGREVTFGKDLDTIERSEDMSDIYTALLCLGPEDAEGNRLEVLVEDADALQRWGRPNPITGVLKHLIGVYEPQSERLVMTLSELEQYGRTELNKRINSVVTYNAKIVDLEHVPGMENKKIRFGDTIRIKDEKFNPPLYVEARVFEQSRDIFENSLKEVKLGDFVEYTEEQVNAIWKQLQQQIKEKISQSELLELTYDKPTIDNKDTQVKTDAEQDATQKAQQAELVAKDHADQVASDAESNANNYTNTVKSQIDAKLLDKAGLEYVDGQLGLKADSALVNTINNTVSDLETTASNLQQAVTDNEVALNAQGGRITTVETDLNSVEGQLSIAITDLSSLEGTVSSQSTQISANTSAISLKANQTELDTVSGDVTDLGSELNVLAGQVELKASESALTNLANDVTQISSDVSSLQIGVNGITADVGSLETTVNGHTSDISSLNSQLTVQAGQISSKVNATYVTNALEPIDNRLDSAESNITQIAGEVSTKAEASTVTSLETRTTNVEQNISALDGAIQQRVTTTTYNAGIASKENTVYKQNSAPAHSNGRLWLNTSVTPNILYRSTGSAWVKSTPTTAGEVGAYSTSQGNTLAGRVTTAESTITQQANEINLKVNKNGVIGAINLSSEVATINASKINLVGAVTVLSDITGNLGTINAGTINGIDINGVNISGSRIVSTSTAYPPWTRTVEIEDGSVLVRANSLQGGVNYNNFFATQNGDIFLRETGDGSGVSYDYSAKIYLSAGLLAIDIDGNKTFKIINDNAYTTIGAETSIYSHIKTSASRFYFDKTIDVDGEIRVYGGSFSSRMTSGAIYGNNGIFGNVSGTMSHGSGYFTIHPYNDSTYDDGTSARFFYAGKGTSSFAARTLHFSTTSGGLSLSAAGFNQTSLLEKKTNIVPFDKSVLDDYRHNLDLYTFDYVDNGIGLQNNIGFVIGDGYKAPKEIMDVEEKSASLYNFISYNAKAIKEVVSIYDDHEMCINTLADRINYLEMENQVLKQLLNQLEGAA